MTKNKRNYNPDYFKVGGSAQPADQVPRPEDEKEKVANQGRPKGSKDVPTGAPGHTPAEGG